MRILRHRPTLRFVALLIECECGRQFLHRLDRPVVPCLNCGATGDLRRLLEKLRTAEASEKRVRAPRAARCAA
jgi:hypothetical protein